ncbi:hypothetical protein [Spirosoma agri]|uniref:Uncharacterized protein n=1 Tax=Spirosoma agri TaxID=1987381 RepID=A0A6M0IL35_9BACT|nr:hypothetical protein [Spirosoma agri]NEU68375.1 hypothetical protein [Spirosoma agri]
MNKQRIDQSITHFTQWTFHEQLPSYIPNHQQPFRVVSIYERSGPQYTKHFLMCLN